MLSNNFYSLVKEEPETISENDMDTNVLPPTSCSMQGHIVAGGGAPPHVVGAPMPPGLPLTPVTPTSMQPPHLKYLDIDPNFEPVARSRSNTWPLPRPEGYIDGEEPSMVPTGDMPTPTDPTRPPGMLGQPGEPQGGGPKKNTSRRNPWGNMSYADLIAQAILSSPDHRATLSQVYDWMVQNVPYFKDKGDSNSSAGWKNSIRHNLSLHNRFMRVQNEGTGKSSWWVLNPDAKPGKSTRRRANTNPMEGGRFEKKRGRVKKKMEALRNGLDTTPSPSSSISENLDLYPDSPLNHPAFGQLSPQDFRPRASSNASSCGRLSPIPAIESDMHDAQVPPMSPGIGGWGPADYWGHHGPHLGHHHLDRYTDQLVDSIGEGLKLGSADWANRHAHPNPSDCMKLTQLSPHGPHHPPPPPGLMNGFHPHHHHHPQGPYGSFEDFHRFGPHNTHTPNYSLPPAHQDKMHTPTRPPHPHSNYTLTNLQVRPQAMSPAHSAHSLSPTQPLGEGHYPGPGGEAHQPTSSFPSPPSSQPSPHSGVPTTEASNMLRQALQHRDQQQQQQQQQQRERDNQHREQQQREAQQQETQQQQHRDQQQQQRSQTAGREGSTTSGSRSQGGSSSSASGSSSSGGSSSATGPNGQPMQDFVDLDTIQGGLECNVEEVIKHELQMGGSLDFSFPQAGHHHGHSAHAHHAHAHHHHAHHQHMAADHSRPQMPGPPAMPPYNCNSIAAGNHWVR